MSQTDPTFSPTEESSPRRQMTLRNASSSRFSGEWHSTPHAHDYTELFYILGGDGQFQINEQRFPVRAHQLVVVNPGIVHTEVSDEARSLAYIVLGIEGLELTIPGSGEERYCLYSFPEQNEVLECMQRILQEMREGRPEYRTVCLAYADIIMVELIRNASASVTQSHPLFPANRQCAAVRHYIERHYKEPITLDILAEKVSINKFYMAHAFKQEYGVSPINYLISCRIREARRLLTETDLSLSQIAAVLGFSSPSYFSQSFRSAEGISPTEFRKTNRRRKPSEP